MINTDGYNNVEYDGYMEQEEEWEREGLLDPAWEKQQKKVGLFPRVCVRSWPDIDGSFFSYYTGDTVQMFAHIYLLPYPT